MLLLLLSQDGRYDLGLPKLAVLGRVHLLA